MFLLVMCIGPCSGLSTAIPHLPNFFGPQFSSLLYTPKLPINRFPLFVHNTSLQYISGFVLSVEYVSSNVHWTV